MLLKKEAELILRDLLEDGDYVYCVLRSVSRSGMTRTIALFICWNNEIIPIHGMVSRWLDLPFDEKNDGIRVRGVGMDMGFYLVDRLGKAIGLNLKHVWL